MEIVTEGLDHGLVVQPVSKHQLRNVLLTASFFRHSQECQVLE
jgi:hypothetical protein